MWSDVDRDEIARHSETESCEEWLQVMSTERSIACQNVELDCLVLDRQS